MSDVKTAIMDAAEKRMRLAGFTGFSFREIAADVGIKSSSVHYHFPTKENLAAAVTRSASPNILIKISPQARTLSKFGLVLSEGHYIRLNTCVPAPCLAQRRE